jgi:Xaa-Pro aminopeptidase
MLSDTPDRQRAQRILAQAGLDVLVACEPEAFRSLTGLSPGVAGLFRRTGAAFCVLPADPALLLGIVIGDLHEQEARSGRPDAVVEVHPLWIETAIVGDATRPALPQIVAHFQRRTGVPAQGRPAPFDLRLSLLALRSILDRQGLLGGRIGLDLGFVPASDMPVIHDVLETDLIHDATPALEQLLSVKTAAEITQLSLAAKLAERGLARLADSAAVGDGVEQLRAFFRDGVLDHASRIGLPPPASWDYVSIGPNPWRPAGQIRPGHIVKVDVGCVVGSYSSDLSRNYVVGKPSADQQRLNDCLERGFDAGLAVLKPGIAFGDVHRAISATLEEEGLHGFSRGHFGHSLGLSVFSEQPPFIAAESRVVVEPGMVLALEVPLYVEGLGAFNIEDTILIREHGPELLTRLPRGLRQIPV